MALCQHSLASHKTQIANYLHEAALLKALSKLCLPLGVNLSQVGLRVTQIELCSDIVVLVDLGLEGQLSLLLLQRLKTHVLLQP